MEDRHPAPFRIGPESGGEFHDIVPQEKGRLVAGVPDRLGGVVPAELGQPGIPHSPEDRLLAGVQGIETDEDEGVPARERTGQDIRHGNPFLQTGRQIPVHHPLIRHILLFQTLPERLI